MMYSQMQRTYHSKEKARPRTKAPAKAAAPDPDRDSESRLAVHKFGKSGAWDITCHTDMEDNHLRATMSRVYADDMRLKLSMDAAHFHLDTSGDWTVVMNC